MKQVCKTMFMNLKSRVVTFMPDFERRWKKEILVEDLVALSDYINYLKAKELITKTTRFYGSSSLDFPEEENVTFEEIDKFLNHMNKTLYGGEIPVA